MVLKGKLMNFRTKSTNRRKNLPADIQIIFPPRSWRGWDWGRGGRGRRYYWEIR